MTEATWEKTTCVNVRCAGSRDGSWLTGCACGSTWVGGGHDIFGGHAVGCGFPYGRCFCAHRHSGGVETWEENIFHVPVFS